MKIVGISLTYPMIAVVLFTATEISIKALHFSENSPLQDAAKLNLLFRTLSINSKGRFFFKSRI